MRRASVTELVGATASTWDAPPTSLEPGTWSLGAASVGLVVAHNAFVVARPTEVSTIVVNLLLVSGFVLLALRWGMTGRSLGLDPSAIGPSAIAAALVVAVVAGALVGVAIALAPAVGMPLADGSGSTGSGPAALWLLFLVGIPIGTAWCEEVLFRGALLALWDRSIGRRRSTMLVSALFGLWHVGAELARAGGFGPGILVGVVATALASAFVLCPLRRRTGGLAVPVALHAAVNAAVLAATVAG